MAEERVVFDFTDEEVRREIVGFKSYTWYNYYDLIKEGRKWYNVEEKEDKVKVSIVTKEDNEYDCIYYKKTIKEIETLVNNKEPVNLRHCYIKDFNILQIQNDKEYEIINFDAKDSFWDGDVIFFGTKFGEGDVIFEGTQFGVGDVRFDEAQFGEGNVIFDSTYFGEGYTSFDSTYFGEGDVRFDSAQFGEGAVSFRKAQFGEGDVSFRKAQFGEGDVRFDYAQFGEGSVILNDSSVDKIMFKRNKFSAHTDLRFKRVNSLQIEDCIIEKTLKISGFHRSFLETWLKKKKSYLSFLQTTNLSQISFEENPKYIVGALKNYIKEKNKRKVKLKKQSVLKSITLVKENYKVLGEYDEEDKAYRLFMKYKTNTWYGWPLLKPFKWIGGYGTQPWSIILFMAGFMAFFAGIYCTFLKDQFKLISETAKAVTSFWDALYYSGITFLTIGYGDISPAITGTTLRFVSIAEGFIGLFLMSYLTVAVVRKLLR